MRISDWSSDVCSSDLDKLSPLAAMNKVRVPVMVVGGELDAYTPPAEIEAMYRAAPPGSEWWILEGLGHDDVVRANDPAFRKRSDEGRVGKACVSTWRSRWSPYH